MSFSDKFKANLFNELIEEIESPINFFDVGSGGELKKPWSLIPEEYFKKISIEPIDNDDEQGPLCISNAEGKSSFYVSQNDRASSLLKPNDEFIERYEMRRMEIVKTMEVSTTTLDAYLKKNPVQFDAVDVNVEGMDYQVLQGATKTLKSHSIKLVKIEYELVSVWHDQGWFADIDQLMRKNNYMLVDLELERSKPVNARHLPILGDPIWGKVFYVPHFSFWNTMISNKNDFYKTLVLFIAADKAALCFDVIDYAYNEAIITNEEKTFYESKINLIFKFFWVDKIQAKLQYYLGISS